MNTDIQELVNIYASTADMGYQLISHIEMSMVRHGGSFGDQRINLANQVEIWGMDIQVTAKLAIDYPHAAWAMIVAQFINLYSWGTSLLKAVAA